MAAVSTIILNSLTMIGEKSIGNSLTSEEQSYFLSRLNSMIDSWSNESLMIYALSQTSFALTTSQGSYTIGTGGNFNMTRPTKLVDPCFIRHTDGWDQPLQIIDMVAYGRIGAKTADGTFPIYIAYDYGYSGTSTATVYFWPEPSAGLTTFINTLQPLQSFSTVSVTLLMPPGYQRAIESNFAVEVAPGFGDASKELIKSATESKAALKEMNQNVPISRLDYGAVKPQASNILNGP